MTAFRLIPLQIHGALEMFTGLFTMAAPFVFGFETPATVLAVIVGALVVGLSLAASDVEGRGTLPVATHHAFDYGLAAGLLGAAAVVGLDGDERASLTFALIAFTQLVLNAVTRYSVRR